jgi:CRP-like cAMP-binding protein
VGEFAWKFFVWAMLLGALSAVSLPLGSLVGLYATFKPRTIAILAAFGAGALLAALSVELVAPTVFALNSESGAAHHGNPSTNFFLLLMGLFVGGAVFVVLDQLVNAHGGFLRKTATTITYFRIDKRKRHERLVKELGEIPFLQSISAEHINTLVPMVRRVVFNDGEIIARQGEVANALFFIMSGTVDVSRDGRHASEVGPQNVLGILPVLTRIPNPGTATARGAVTAIALAEENLDRLRGISPEFDRACRELSQERLEILEQFATADHEVATDWAQDAARALSTGADIPTPAQLRSAKQEHGGAPLAIWLGILIDGIPESFVIGAGLLIVLQAKAGLGDDLRFAHVIPFTLIAGLFLSNFPEALSSSASMLKQGWSKGRIFFMWFSLMVITAVGAGLGYALAGLDPTWLIFAEGLAAGAMLTMIAAAMIPEAVHMGNANAVGLSTLAGFVSAIAFKILE